MLIGSAAAIWFWDVLLEVANVHAEQNLFRSFREGNKVFVVQKQRNGRGGFVTVTVLGDTKRKGCVIVPEGRATWGWRGLSKVVDGLMGSKATAEHGTTHRRPGPIMAQGTRNSNFGKESQTFKEAVILGGDIPSTSAMNSGINVNFLQNSNRLVNELSEISLKLVLGVGPNNKWVVKWAEVLDDPSDNPVGNTQAQVEDRSNLLTNQRPNDPIEDFTRATSAPRPKPVPPQITQPVPVAPVIHKVWRPRVTVKSPEVSNTLEGTSGSTKQDLDKVSVHSGKSDSQGSISSLIPTSSSGGRPIAEAMQGIGEVNRTWESARDWSIELRDGRRFRIPMDLRAPVPESLHEEDAITTKLIQWLSSHREERESGEGEDDSEWDMDSGSEPDRDSLSLSGIPEQGLDMIGVSKGEFLDPECHDPKCVSIEALPGTMGGDPQEPISVEPLAVVLPLGLEHSGTEVARSSGCAGRQPSDWAMRKQKGVGKVLGASYEGYEQTVTELLMDIEARYLQRKEIGRAHV